MVKETTTMMIFISPAKTFRETQIKSEQTPIFKKETADLLKQLKVLSVSDLKKGMHVSDKVAKQTHQYYQTFNNHLQPAIFTYYGHQFKHIDVDTFDQQQLKRLNQKLYIMSGFYGFLKPLDLISCYRLDMQDKTITNLYAHWTKTIQSYIQENHPNTPLINLASHEFGQMIEHLDQTYTIEFYQIKDQKPKIHSMEAKRLRGLMARYLILHDIRHIKDIKTIQLDGYTYNKKLSEERKIIFTKIL